MTAANANGWTGGQYSVFRAVLGVYLICQFACIAASILEAPFDARGLGEADEAALRSFLPNILLFSDSTAVVASLVVAAAGLSAVFALGIRDRYVGLVLAYLTACCVTASPETANTSALLVAGILLAHAFIPQHPYGSWDARGRIDPGADWRMPAPIFVLAWIALGLAYAYGGAMRLVSSEWFGGSALPAALGDPNAERTALGELAARLPSPLLSLATWSVLALEIGFAPLALVRKTRPWIWSAAAALQVILLALGISAEASAGLLLLQFFAFDPAWVQGKDAGHTATIFYDGGCGLCHRFVRFALAEDREGSRFRFSPLESDAYAALRNTSAQREWLDEIDSIVLSLPDGRLFVRAAAVLEIGKRLGGLWRIGATALCAVPRGLLDTGYDQIARIRQRIFSRPPDACPILPPHLRDRFDHP